MDPLGKILILPFTTGYLIPERNTSSLNTSIQNGVQNADNRGLEQTTSGSTSSLEVNSPASQDGFIPSLALMLLLIGMSIAATTSGWIIPVNAKEVKLTANVIKSVYLVAGIIGMWKMYLNSEDLIQDHEDEEAWDNENDKESDTVIDKSEENYHVEDEFERDSLELVASNDFSEEGDSGGVKEYLKASPALCGVTVFFIISSFADVLQFIAIAECLPTLWNLCPSEFFTMLFYACDNVISLLFMSSQLMFVFIYHHQRVKQSAKVRYTLAIILVATLSYWYQLLLIEDKSVFSSHGIPHITSTCLSQITTLSNQTSEDLQQCVKFQTPLFQLFNNRIKEFILPNVLEFSMMIGEICFHLFFSLHANTAGKENIKAEGSNEVNKTEKIPSPPLLESNAPCSSQKRHSLSTNVDISSPDSSQGLTYDIQDLQPTANKFLLISLIAMGLLITLSGLASFTKSQAENSDLGDYKYILVCEIYKCIWYALLSTSTLVAFSATRNSVYVCREFNGIEIIVLVSTLASFTLIGFDIIAIKIRLFSATTASTIPIAVVWATLCEKILNMIQIFLQVSFLSQVIRVRQDDRKKRFVIKNVLLILSIANLGLWVIESFFEVHNVEINPISSKVFGKDMYRVLSLLLGPMIYFFRFNSFLLYISAYVQVE